MSKSAQNNNNQNKETEMIDVSIPYQAYLTIPLITEEDTVLQSDGPQESRDDATVNSVNSDNEAKTEIIVNTSEKKNSWVWSFYRQVQTSDDEIFTICEVETDGVKCNKRYKTKGSTGNLINHLLKHGITKDNPQPRKVCKIIS